MQKILKTAPKYYNYYKTALYIPISHPTSPPPL